VERVDLKVIKGSTPVYELTFIDENKAVIDITGYTVFFTVKTKPDDLDAAALISYTITSHYNATGGISLVSLTAADTARIGNFYYDFKVKTDEAKIYYPLGGTITFGQNITIRTA